MEPSGPSRFHTTQWSLIAALPGRTEDRDQAQARAALEHLCATYWRPLYTFARCRGSSPDEAQDLTQAFLTRVIETGGLVGATPDRGRFRSYLLGAMKHFMAHARDRERAQKRGGKHTFRTGDLDALEAHVEFQIAGASQGDPGDPTQDADRAFDRDWAHETTACALRVLADEWASRGKIDEFEAFRPVLTGEGPPRVDLAASLGMTENAVSVAVHRLRQRYAALVRESVARTVADEADIDDEMRYLIGVLRKK